MTDSEKWIYDGRLLRQRKENATWEIAWWLVEGQMKALDSGFTISSKILQKTPKTLENYYRVGLAYPRGKNHPDLSFTSHRELLREWNPDARSLVMSQAIENKWYADDIIRYFEGNPPTPRPLVGVDQPPSSKNRTPYQRKYYVGAEVKCPECGHCFPIKGNKTTRRAKKSVADA